MQRLSLRLITAASLGLVAAGDPLRADVAFENCVRTADGGISCDTRPTGETVLDAEAARFGLFNLASPGWNEFSPFQDLDDGLGGSVD